MTEIEPASEQDITDYTIATILCLMDSGLVDLEYEPVKVGDKTKIQPALKANELATYTLPRRFSIFVPAFSKVERCYGGTYKDLQDIIGAFIDYLKDHCYSEEDIIDSRDKTLLESLVSKKDSLLKMYSAGYKFRDWDIDLRYDKSRVSTRNKSDDSDFTSREEKFRKQYYSYLATIFIDSLPNE